MKTIAIVVALLVSACGGKKDDCQIFVDKIWPVMTKVMAGDKKPPADAKAKFVEECRKDIKNKDQGKDKEMFDCVVKASGDAAVAACMKPAFEDYMGKSKSSMAKLNLNKLGKNMKVEYMTSAALPTGKVGPLPAGEPCCKRAGGKCPPIAFEDVKGTPLEVLEFLVSEPGDYQYSYESTDMTTATATATGDLDCDGTVVTYKLTAKGDPNTGAVVDIAEPTNED